MNKNYVVASLPLQKHPLPDEKSGIFRILNKGDFRLRYVNEFIYMSEKVRIFEFDLDDRALEVIKYNYVAVPMGLSTDAKIILTGTDGNALIFTIYDEYDKPKASHRVGIDAYARACAEIGKEIIDSPIISWQKIDINWAKIKGEEK